MLNSTRSGYYGVPSGQHGSKVKCSIDEILEKQAARRQPPITKEELEQILKDEKQKSRDIIGKFIPNHPDIVDRTGWIALLSAIQNCHIIATGPGIADNLYRAPRYVNMIRDARPELFDLLKNNPHNTRELMEFVQIFICTRGGTRWYNGDAPPFGR